MKRGSVFNVASFVGKEVDVLVKYHVTKFTNAMIGYSHLSAGSFLKDTGTSSDAGYFYVQSVLNSRRIVLN